MNAGTTLLVTPCDQIFPDCEFAKDLRRLKSPDQSSTAAPLDGEFCDCFAEVNDLARLSAAEIRR